MKKSILVLLSLMLMVTIIAGCTSGSAMKEYDTITIVWYPNESGNDLRGARDEIGAVIESATGKKVEHQLTTDYAIAIETIANGNAHVAFMGAQGYVEANIKNSNVLPLFVSTGKSGTLDDAVYYSWLTVRKGEESQYQKSGSYSMDNIQGKRFSFVSNSSTSGFVVPAAGIISHFSKMEQWKSLELEDLLEGGPNNLFSEVLFGGSHQGSAVNLLSGNADVSAVCDVCINNYIDISVGQENSTGSIYKVRQDAAEPFNNLGGEEFVLISVTPVLNAPFVINKDVLNEEDITAIINAITSEEVANNEKIFVPRGADFKGLFSKTADERFVKVDDSWFNPIRELK